MCVNSFFFNFYWHLYQSVFKFIALSQIAVFIVFLCVILFTINDLYSNSILLFQCFFIIMFLYMNRSMEWMTLLNTWMYLTWDNKNVNKLDLSIILILIMLIIVISYYFCLTKWHRGCHRILYMLIYDSNRRCIYLAYDGNFLLLFRWFSCKFASLHVPFYFTVQELTHGYVHCKGVMKLRVSMTSRIRA